MAIVNQLLKHFTEEKSINTLRVYGEKNGMEKVIFAMLLESRQALREQRKRQRSTVTESQKQSDTEHLKLATEKLM